MPTRAKSRWNMVNLLDDCSLPRSRGRARPSTILDAWSRLTIPPDRRARSEKRKAPGDTPGAFYDLRLRLTASPSAASDQPHLLVTTTHWDHLLPLVSPRPTPGTISEAGRALAPRATVARTSPYRIQGAAAE